MFMGMGGQNNNQNAGDCWRDLAKGFKALFVSQLVLSLLIFLVPGLFSFFPNLISQTIFKFQVWRLFTSILLPGLSPMAFINVLFYSYILYQCLPTIEKKFSTSYIMLEILLQIVLCNSCLVIIGVPLMIMGLGNDMTFLGYGMIPLIFIFLWANIAENPDQPTRFCCFPCLIPMKFIPLCFLLILGLFGQPFIPMCVYCLLGYYQFVVKKSSILQLPLKVYRKFDSCMPKFFTDDPSYTKVTSVEASLRSVCKKGGFCQWGNNQRENQPFVQQERRQQRQQRQDEPVRSEHIQRVGNADRVEVMGGAVAIGGSSGQQVQQTDFKNHWRQKDEETTDPDRPVLQSDQKYQQNLMEKPQQDDYSQSQLRKNDQKSLL